jgi:hypothetical protein
VHRREREQRQTELSELRHYLLKYEPDNPRRRPIPAAADAAAYRIRSYPYSNR